MRSEMMKQAMNMKNCRPVCLSSAVMYVSKVNPKTKNCANDCVCERTFTAVDNETCLTIYCHI